jgi:hypothetical protein
MSALWSKTEKLTRSFKGGRFAAGLQLPPSADLSALKIGGEGGIRTHVRITAQRLSSSKNIMLAGAAP